MHKSPDPFERDLERAIALENSPTAPDDSELAADWALKRELAGLGVAELPHRVRAAVDRNAVATRSGPWLWSMAAALVAAVIVTVVLQSPVRSPAVVMPTAHDLADFQLALDTIDRTGKRAMALAGREVQESFVMPELDLSELPYAGYIKTYFERPDRLM